MRRRPTSRGPLPFDRICALMARSSSPPAAVSDLSSRRSPDRFVTHYLIASMRPRQWTKNLLVFAGLLFGRRLMEPAALAGALSAFAIFCGLSGAVYLVNDVADRET